MQSVLPWSEEHIQNLHWSRDIIWILLLAEINVLTYAILILIFFSIFVPYYFTNFDQICNRYNSIACFIIQLFCLCGLELVWEKCIIKSANKVNHTRIHELSLILKHKFSLQCSQGFNISPLDRYFLFNIHISNLYKKKGEDLKKLYTTMNIYIFFTYTKSP